MTVLQRWIIAVRGRSGCGILLGGQRLDSVCVPARTQTIQFDQTPPEMFLTVAFTRMGSAPLFAVNPSRAGEAYVSILFGERGVDGGDLGVDGWAHRAHCEGFSFEEQCGNVAH